MTKKQKRRPGELRVSVIVTITADPDRLQAAFSSTLFDVDGPAGVVKIVDRAYTRGALNAAIDAFTAAVEEVVTEPALTVRPGSVGRA